MKRYQLIICMSVFLSKIPMAWHLIGHGIMMPGIQPVYCINTTKEHETHLTADLVKQLHKEACDPSCPSIVVGKQFYYRSIISDFELYCDRFPLRMVAQFLVMFGVFIGNFIYSYAADKVGRKWPFIVSILTQPVFGVWMAFSSGIVSFLVAKFLLCINVGGSMINGFVLFSEVSGKKWRPLMGILYHLPFTFGHLTLSGLAYVFYYDWRYLQLTISLPILVLVYLIWVLPESPRWLLAVGKVEQAIKNLERIAKCNGLPTENIREIVTAEIERKAALQAGPVRKGKLKDMFKNCQMSIVTVGMWLNWLAVTCAYYGMAQLSSAFTESFYINNALSAALQIPGVMFLLWTINAWGRKASQISSDFISAAGCLAVALTPAKYKIIPAGIAMFGMANCFPCCYVYAAELFPTTIRNIGVGSSSSIGRIGGMTSPVFEYLKEYGTFIPPLLFAILLAIAGVFIIFLPETKGRELPTTVEDLKEWSRKKSHKSNQLVLPQ